MNQTIDERAIRANFKLAVDMYPRDNLLRRRADYAIVPPHLLRMIEGAEDVEVLTQKQARERFPNKRIEFKDSMKTPLILYRKNWRNKLTGRQDYELNIPTGVFAQAIYL